MPQPNPPTPSRRRFEQVTAVVGESGALVLATTGAIDAALDITNQLTNAGFVAWNTLELLAFCALIVGFAGVASSRAAGQGVFPATGLAVAFLGLATFAAVSVVAYVDGSMADRLNVVAISVTSAGMLLIGVAVVRARQWHGWNKYMPLVCGLYGGGVELPGALLLRPSLVFDVVVVGNWLTWVGLNVALWLATPALARVSARR